MSSITQPIDRSSQQLSVLMRDYSELIKMRVTVLIVMTARTGVFRRVQIRRQLGRLGTVPRTLRDRIGFSGDGGVQRGD